ncbi:MAG: hypothetical protein K6G76_01700 [Lachnospiraceae bacterium]|nr:hypothetical protein [Lachnospiraceae bacterium]
MGRIWNALRYGDAETRKCIGSVILFSVIGIVLIVVAGITSMFNLFILGMISGVVAIIISQTFTLVEDDFVAEVDSSGSKDSVRSVSVKRNGVTGQPKKPDKKNKSSETEGGMEDDDLAEGEKKADDGKEDEPADTEEEKKDPDRFEHYDKSKLRKIKKKFHVKKDHRAILIDRSDKYKIHECPAFIWRVHNKVSILLLEKEPRKIVIPRELIKHVDYNPGVRVDKATEYVAFKKENLITSTFSPYLPDYQPSRVKNDPSRMKNLYKIYPDINITNNSIGTVMDLLYLNFMPKDKYTTSDKLNGYFKRVYAANILYKDKVYSINDYKDEVEKILGEMTYAKMPEKEYDFTLDSLVKAHMISTEYADYYKEHRK